MSMNGKFFRPPPSAKDNDSDDDDSSSDEEETTTTNNSTNNNNAGNKRDLSSSESDDDDDDDDEEEEEEEKPPPKKSHDKSSKPPSKKARSSTAETNFFDEEAEVDDSDTESVYGDVRDPHDVVKKHYTEEDIEREYQNKEFEQTVREIDERRRRAAGGMPRYDDDDDVENVVADIENRFRRDRRRVDLDGDADVARDDAYAAVSQQSLLPTVGKDPSIWMFDCAPNKENELVLQIMNKCAANARRNIGPSGVTGAIAGKSKGKIFIESSSEPAVIEVVRGVRNLRPYSMRLIPIADMTTILDVKPTKQPVNVNDWVRMTRGHFKGDLAMVKDVRAGGMRAVVQCVPRIDLALADMTPEEARVRRRTVRPPQKFFNSKEMVALKRVVDRERFPGGDEQCDKYEGNYYYDGYMLKEVSVTTQIRKCGPDEPPTLDELQRFRRRRDDSEYDDYNNGDGDGDENEASRRAGSLLDELGDVDVGDGSALGGGLIVGDTVEVVEGDLIGMRGKLVDISADVEGGGEGGNGTVRIAPDDASGLGGTDTVEFLASQVRKLVAVGAHVKVTCGRYANETGTVVAVERLEGDTDSTAVVLTDMTHKEISVRVPQLQESAEIASGRTRLAGYELHDLVVLAGGVSANEVGIIVRVGREEFSVMNHHGVVREVRPEELRGKRNAASNRAVALDAGGSQIRCGDSLTVAEGPHKGKSATVKRMNRAQLFLYSQTRQEHAGIFVARSRVCVLAGSHRKSGGGHAGTASLAQARPRHPRRGGRNEDSLLQKTVRVQSGRWKGYMGCVCDANPTHVQVELHSRLKKVMVLRDRVAVVGDRYGRTDDPDRHESDARGQPLGATTPLHALGAATPVHHGGARTPMHHGGTTPMHDAGSFTPSHNGSADGGDADVWRPDHGSRDDDDGASSGWGSTAGASSTTTTDKTSAAQQHNDDDTDDLFSTTTNNDSAPGGSSGWGSSNSATSNNDNTTNGDDDDHKRRDDKSHSWTPSSTSDNRAADDAETNGGGGGGIPVWFMDRVCVRHKPRDAEGTLREIRGDVASVSFADGTTEDDCGPSKLELVKPKEHDTVLVTGGADVGVEGELVCIDGTDAILKDSSEEYRIVDFGHLAKIQE